MKIFFNGIGYIEGNELRKHFEYHKIRHPEGNINLIFNFDNEAEMNNFKSQFTKSFSLRDGAENKLYLTLLPLNKNTGLVNEAAEKKISKILKVLGL